MKKQFLKIAGVTSEAAFYKKYPTEEAFFAAHPEARNMMAMGGTPEAYPQIATFDKAFSYGVKPGPQYLAHGGSAFPQAQTEAQFFIPIYTDVYNPYNKAMGGSNVEMYPNAKMMPHWGPTNVWFQDGGQEGMTQEQPELDRLGVQNRTGAFANMLKATAAKSNARTAMNQVGMAKYGKELSLYAPGGYTINPNQRIASSITQQMSPTSSQFAGDAMPPTYNQQLQANIAAAMMQQPYGYNQMAMGNMNNFLPSVYNWNDPSQFMFQVKGSPNWKFRTDIPGMGKRRGVSNISLGEAWGLYSGDPAAREEALKKLNPSRITETPVGLFKRRMRRDYYWDPATQSNTTFKDWGTGTAGQQSAPSNQATSAYGPYADGFAYGADGSSEANPMEGDVNAPMLAPGQQGYDPTVRSAQSPTFDQNGMLNQISTNEQTNFGTKPVNEVLKPGASKNWQDYKIDNTPGAAYDTPEKVKAAWDSSLKSNPDKQKQWDAFNDMPAPLKAVAQDQLFNSSFDPRVITMAAAGVDQGYTGKGAPVLSNKEYRSWLKNNADSLWSKNKDLINQQYNDDPQAFTETVSANRDIAYQKSRTSDKEGKLTDFPSSSGGPGTQYPAWSGRTKATQDYVDKTYFNPSTGYVAPQFFQNAATTTTKSQAPSNANSMDAATAQKKASMMNPNVNQAFINAQQSGPPYRTPVGPVVGPDGYAYGGYTGYKFGGSYNQGDVVYMTDDEIAEFVRNGGQIEEME